MIEPSPWKLRYDIGFVRTVIWFSGVASHAQPLTETHLLLYDRYWRLSVWHETHGRARRSEKLKTIALRHWEASGYDEPPPAVALAMPIPRPPSFTNADAKAPRGPSNVA